MVLHIQLWSYNYEPEPTGIAPVSAAWARGMRDLGHTVEVVAAHPHYPEPRWGRRLKPYREVRDGIALLRLPLWIGRDTALERYRQELSFMASQTLAIPFLSKPDVIVVVSPSFPALLPAIMATKARAIPWMLWLHDILPDGATASGLVDEKSAIHRLSRKLENAAYGSADRVIVLSRAFTDNLVAKGVPADKIELIYDPATRVPSEVPRSESPNGGTRLLSMGNIGFSQGLAGLIGGFEAATELNRDAKIVITGDGMAAPDTRAELKTGRVEMVGLVSDEQLEQELKQADIALVTQRHTGSEFNIPSKIMNFMAYGLPVLAAVNPGGEVARIVEDSGAGWVVDSSEPAEFPRRIAEITADPGDIARRGEVALAYAQDHFTQDGFARRFERSLLSVLAEGSGPLETDGQLPKTSLTQGMTKCPTA